MVMAHAAQYMPDKPRPMRRRLLPMGISTTHC